MTKLKKEQVGNPNSRSLTFVEAGQPIDFSKDKIVTIEELTDNLTVQEPTGVEINDTVSFIFKQDSVGGHTITFFEGSVIEPFTVNKKKIVSFFYDGTDFILLSGGESFFFEELKENLSGSSVIESSDRIHTTSTTEILETNEENSGGIVQLIAPETGTYTKTVRALGVGISSVFSKVKLGYISMSGDDVVKIGNLDININQSHALGVLVRVDKAQLVNFGNAIIPVETNQDDGSGNKLFQLRINGSQIGNNTNNNISLKRSSRTSSTPSSSEEYIQVENFWDTVNAFSWYNPTTGPVTPVWLWIWSIGKGPNDRIYDGQTASYGGGSNNYFNSNINLLGAAAHNSIDTIGAMMLRKTITMNFDAYDTGTGVWPLNLENVDLSIKANQRQLQLARMVLINNPPDVDSIAAITYGSHPRQVHDFQQGDFCYDFGTLPSEASITAGTPTFTPVQDGPIANVYNGETTQDVVINYQNQMIV